MLTPKVGIYRSYRGPVPMDATGQPLPKNQWPLKRSCSWVVRWYGGEIERFSRSFKTRKEAERFAETKQDEVRQGRGDPPQAMSLLAFARDHKKLSRGATSRKTLLMQVAALRQLAQQFGWDRDIQKLTSRDIEMFRSTRSKDDVSPMTVNKEVKSLRCLFNHAIKRGYLSPGKNPCTGVSLIKVGEKRPAYMSPAKFERLYEQADSLIQRTLLVVFYTTALRRNEALNLTWDDIDFENAVVHVARHSASGYVQAWTPKDHERREVPFPTKAMDLLRELKQSAPVGCPYVFMGSNRWSYYQQQVDGKQWKPETSELVNNVLKKFQIRCKRAQIGNFTLHDLRRSCITNWARQGLPIHVAQKLAGHADIETTQKFYLSVQEEDLQRARAVQQQLVSGLPMVHATDQLLTISGQNRSFPKRRIFVDGTQLDEEKEVA